MVGLKSQLIQRLVSAHDACVAELSPIDKKFARVFSKWILEPRSTGSRKKMAMGHSNEPVMLAGLASFIREEATADFALSANYEV